MEVKAPFATDYDYCTLIGFVQCVSDAFRIKQHNVILIKLASSRNCFCQPCRNIIVRWEATSEDVDDKQARSTFLHNCRVGRWITATKLLQSKVYRGQHREQTVWLFIPGTSVVQKDTVSISGSCSKTKCPSWPVFLMDHLRVVVIQLHASARIVEVALCTQNLSAKPPVGLYAPRTFLGRTLSAGCELSLYNVWCLPFSSCIQRCSRCLPRCDAIILSGIYSSCRFPSKPSSSDAEEHRNTSASCSKLCCLNFGNISVDSFRPIDISSIFKDWINTKLKTFASSSLGSPFLSKDTDSTLDAFEQVLLETLVGFDQRPPYRPQLTEEFIEFPMLHHEVGTQAFEPAGDFTVLSRWLQALSSALNSGESNPDSLPSTQFFMPGCRTKLVYESASFDRCPVPSFSDLSLVYRTHSMKSVVDEKTSTSWHIGISVALSNNASSDDEAVSKCPVLIARVVWNSQDGCYHLQNVNPSSLSIVFGCRTESDCSSVESLPLILTRDLQTPNEPFPLDQTIVAVLGARIVHEINDSSLLPRLSFNRSPGTLSSNLVYIVATQLIPLEFNPNEYTANSSLLETQPQRRSETVRVTSISIPQFNQPVSDSVSSRSTDWTSSYCYQLEADVISPQSDSSRMSTLNLVLTGLSSFRWYNVLEVGSTHQLSWQSTLGEDRQILLNVKPVPYDSASTPPFCDHMLEVDQLILIVHGYLERLPVFPLPSFNVRGLLVQKTRMETHWLLKLCPVSTLDNITQCSDCIDVYLLDVIEILVPIMPCLSTVQWLNFGGFFSVLQFYRAHVSQPPTLHGPLQLTVSPSSQIKMVHYSTTVDSYKRVQPRLLSSLSDRNCTHCQSLQALEPNKTCTEADWLLQSPGTIKSAEVVHIRGHITRCLEFYCWQSCSPSTDPDDRSSVHAFEALRFCLRLIVTDGSGSALVQVGTNGPSKSEYRCVSNPTEPTDGENFGIKSLEMTRLLFGLDSITWERLCGQLLKLITAERSNSVVSVQFTDNAKRPANPSPLEIALRAFLTSSAFCRTYNFCLQPRCFVTQLRGPWRLRQVHLAGPNRSVYLVLPSSQYFEVKNIEPC
ncbi:unnamed protein product [Calicophoron daubneyi]|uniref:CST complex subunit CTC1 n=1 Tax=Calicophoron daubneyi TaxID=300641 RepID=A0AAV2TYZ2_CALDB